MKNQTYIHSNKQNLSLGEWKIKIANFIKQSIIDIIKLRVNKNACENSCLIDYDYEHISYESYKLQNNYDKKENKKESKN